MKRYLLFAPIVIVSLIFCSPAFAGWKDKIVKNQFKAIKYIEQLKAGTTPDEIEQPYLRYDEKSKANAANHEIKEAITEAEEYAREGNFDKIEIPQFRLRLVTDEYRQTLRSQYER